MNIGVSTSLIINGHTITERQIEVLRCIHETGSKNSAAKKLGISPPVVHKYMESIEKGTGIILLNSTPGGTELTADALKIIETADMMESRCTVSKKFTVGCSPVTSDLIMMGFSASKVKGEVIITNDAMNVKMLKDGIVDLIILEDPIFLFDLDKYHWQEIGHMDMIHVNNGPDYIKYKYGAQRVAYEYLEAAGDEYNIISETHNLDDLLNSGCSFFIDEFILMRKGIKLMSATDKKLLRHSITAVFRKETKCADRLLKSIVSKKML